MYFPVVTALIISKPLRQLNNISAETVMTKFRIASEHVLPSG